MVWLLNMWNIVGLWRLTATRTSDDNNVVVFIDVHLNFTLSEGSESLKIHSIIAIIVIVIGLL